ncbi:MAG: YceI family protein [Pseudomonadota bacterium]
MIAPLAAGLLLPGVTGAALKTDPVATTVTVQFKQLNVPVEAKFKKINAQIDYDAARPNLAKAIVDIDIASFDLGDPEYNKEVLKKEWFNAAQFPKATFVSSAIVAGTAGKLTVSGKLTIKGKTADVSFPLSVKQQAGQQIFDGALPIKRTQFNIGEGEWKDVSIVGDEVVIKFHVVGSKI